MVVPGEQQKPCLVYEALAFLALGYGGHMLALGLANFETKLEQRVAMAEAYHQAYGIGSMDRELELDAGLTLYGVFNSSTRIFGPCRSCRI